MANDQQIYQENRKTWVGFLRLMQWSIAAIVVTLLLMAYFLV